MKKESESAFQIKKKEFVKNARSLIMVEQERNNLLNNSTDKTVIIDYRKIKKTNHQILHKKKGE